jgi:hypothetical protein
MSKILEIVLYILMAEVRGFTVRIDNNQRINDDITALPQNSSSLSGKFRQ